MLLQISYLHTESFTCFIYLVFETEITRGLKSVLGNSERQCNQISTAVRAFKTQINNNLLRAHAAQFIYNLSEMTEYSLKYHITYKAYGSLVFPKL
jgi:hypothetical protein